MSEGGQQNLSDMGIFDEVFPDNVSISDLCDCGRCKRMHPHKPIPTQHRGPFPKTDYMSTYEAVQNPRPRSSKRPPATARETRPAPMYFTTNQKDSFKNLGHVERVQPIVHEDKYEPSTEPIEGVSYYAKEFTAKRVDPEPILRQSSRRELIHREPATFDGTTTNKQHFKRWVPQPSLTFGELPSFTGSILYPEKENVPLSTMRQSYAGTYAPPVGLIKNATSSIKLEGEHEFGTSYSTTYQQIDGDHRPRLMVQKDMTPLAAKRGAFKGVTQTMSDFPGYHGNQPRPPKAVAPPEPKIDLRFNNKRSFTTENRSIYRGHDIKEHPAPPSCKKEEAEYTLPGVKFETETSQKRDYHPIDLKTVDNVRMKIPTATMGVPLDAHFDGTTMNKEFFQNWGTQPRPRYGDFHENRPYIPPQDKFTAESVTKSSFLGKTMPVVQPFKPNNRPMSKSGEHNFNTVYQSEFQKKEARMCRAQVYLIQQELRRRKLEKQAALKAGPATTSKSAPHTKVAA